MAKKHTRQVAALPWRPGDNGLQVLLVTSRETRRWVIPKGWPMRGLRDHDAAAREALEEAGIRGDISAHVLGTYSYDKRREPDRRMNIEVDVYPLRVRQELSRWREKGERSRQWFDAAEAQSLVQEPGLAELIRRFCHASGGGEPEEPTPGLSDSFWTRFLRRLGHKS